MLPHVHRVTKHDPADRDQHGHYTGAESEISDHGTVEAAYLMAVAAFAEDTGIDQLVVREPQIGESTPSDRGWAILKSLRRGQLVTGTVTCIADFGVTFVDIGGFTAVINIPEQTEPVQAESTNTQQSFGLSCHGSQHLFQNNCCRSILGAWPLLPPIPPPPPIPRTETSIRRNGTSNSTPPPCAYLLIHCA
ncbi:hypothetical protein [Streptomyces sp. NPDC102437]|uniref:hypothetical protein n=1 Tax=Streptomyces sp. NPDC102437 TaxID=3366175 RepID=UPI0037F7BD9D